MYWTIYGESWKRVEVLMLIKTEKFLWMLSKINSDCSGSFMDLTGGH